MCMAALHATSSMAARSPAGAMVFQAGLVVTRAPIAFGGVQSWQ